MAQRAYIATVQIIIKPKAVESEGDACDWMSGLLSENEQVLDWQYLNVGGQRLTPSEKYISDNYEEGEGFQ